MPTREPYTPGPARGARVRRNGEEWTLILVRELRHAPENVWEALTDPAQLREWAPFEADGSLATVGAVVTLTWLGTGRPTRTTVTRADAPQLLEYGEIRWELEPHANGTRLTLWHQIDRRFISWAPPAGTSVSMFWTGSSMELPSAASPAAMPFNSAAGSS